MYKSVVYKGDELLGEVEVYPQIQNEKNGEVKEVRISHFSQPSERCSPLAVLCTIATGGVRFRMESSCKPLSRDSLLFLLHSSCLKENKTAVMPLGEEELHLVAMHSSLNENQWPCFWCFKVALGLYSSCLVMLNLRCLGIVFDLDETLIVANTLRSFEDRIDALQRRINAEVDPRRITGMLAEVKRYQDDKMILKQYAENDQVDDNGKVIKIQSEVVPAFSDSQQPIVRPIIRLHEKNIILTRINPLIRDTSVLVRLRPAWEDLRSYLTARGRKRFEVYVCTMAERDYALEMWRLLDPESNLINSKELLERIVCVKSGSKKSLHNVFQDGNCHPKMALVIDDRLKVWDEKDQPRVHVVPAFAPYYAPQAEANNAIPVLCVARNVACNVRGGFFKEFDEGLLQRISKVSYADDISDILSPDVSNYLVSEHFCNWDDSAASNVSKDPPISDGMADAEVERRLKEGLPAPSSIPLPINDRDLRLAHSVQSAVTSLSSSPPPPPPPPPPVHPDQYFLQVPSLGKSIVNVGPPDPSLQTSSAREEGEVPESELDPDTRRRLLILQHGQDTRDHASSEPSVPVGPPTQVSLSQVQSRGNWFPAEEEMSPRQLSRTASKEVSLDSEALLEKNRSYHSSFFHKSSSVRADRTLQENLRLPKEAFHRDVRFRSNNSSSSFNSFSGEEGATSRSSFGNSNFDSEFRRSVLYAEAPARYLQGIAIKCGTKVEFKPALIDSMELKFSIEVWFSGEKIGEGIGRTRKEALHQASEASLLYLAQRYISHVKPDSSAINENLSLFDGLPNDGNTLKRHRFSDDCTTFSTALESSRLLDHGLDGSRRSMGGSVSDLKELCMMEGLGVVFQGQPPISTSPMQKDEVYAQVEIDGQVLGKGVGLTWDEAKMQAAEKALGSLKSMLGQYSKKREVSPRWLHGMSSKRGRPEFSRVTQRVPSEKYPKNGASVP